MAGDDEKRQVERVTSRTAVEVENEIPCQEAGEEVDVGEPSVQPRSVDDRKHSQFHDWWKNSQFPQFEWVDHQAQESDPEQVQEQVKQTQMIVKRNVSDSEKAEVRKDKVKMLKNWQRRQKNNILMQMLRCLHTRHGELKTLSGMQQMQRPNK